MEAVVREDDHRHRRVTEVIGDVEDEPVMVDENRIQRLVKQLSRDRPFELVEPQIQEFQARKLQNNLGELSGEPIVAEIQFKEELQLPELVRDSPTEPIRVNMEQCEIHQQAELLREVAGDVAVVEVDSGDGVDLVVVERRSAENSGVVADFGSDPVGGEIHGIGENGLLPCL